MMWFPTVERPDLGQDGSGCLARWAHLQPQPLAGKGSRAGSFLGTWLCAGPGGWRAEPGRGDEEGAREAGQPYRGLEARTAICQRLQGVALCWASSGQLECGVYRG